MSTSVLPTLDVTHLTPLVRRATAHTVNVTEWHIAQLQGGAGEGLGVFRVAGQAVNLSAALPNVGVDWSLILKILGPRATANDPAGWNYWKREALAYQSGLLDQLPGSLRAPRCYGVVEQADGTVWLWLEEIIDQQTAPWSLAEFGEAAYQVGCFNGAYLAGHPLPTASWLKRDWLRNVLEESHVAIVQLRQALDNPWLQRALPPQQIGSLLQLWEERQFYLRALDRLPVTLCHMDFFRRNLLWQAQSVGDAQLYVIDWADVSYAALGEELVPLIQASVQFFEFDRAQAMALEETALTAYLAGLEAAGWAGDSRHVRLGYAIAVALRYHLGKLNAYLPGLLNEAVHPFIEQLMRHPMSEICDCMAFCLEHFTLRQATVARTLIQDLDWA